MDGSHKKSLNFKKMKKQILLLTFVITAILAGSTSVLAQLIDDPQLDAAVANCPIPLTLNCGTAGALNPLPGETYEYDIEVTPAGGTIHWFVTTDVNIITTGGTLTTNRESIGGTYILSAGTTTGNGNATYNDDANTGDILEVAWNYFDPGTTVLLVAYAEDADGCTNNIEAYKIEPMFNFILEIAALEDDGEIQDPANIKECVSPVQSAVYNTGSGTLDMDYGDNYIFYLVTSANWVNSWQPAFTPPTSAEGSTIGTVEWAYADEANDPAATWYGAADPVEASHWGVTSVGSNGQCIVLRVNIDHENTNEMTAAETYTMGVDGVMYDAAAGDYSNGSLADLDDDGSGGCSNTITDQANYIINPRPDINAQDPTPFINKN